MRLLVILPILLLESLQMKWLFGQVFGYLLGLVYPCPNVVGIVFYWCLLSTLDHPCTNQWGTVCVGHSPMIAQSGETKPYNYLVN